MLDGRYHVLGVDAAFRTLFGELGPMVGRPFDEMVSDRDRRGAVALSQRLTRHHGEVIDLPLVITAGGRDRFVRARIAAVVASGDARFVAYLEPGEEQDSLTYELALARQRWSAIMQRSDEGIVLVDRDGTILQHNLRFFELMRFRTAHGVSLTEAALEGRRLGPLLPRAFEQLAQALARGDDDFELSVDSDGRMLEVEGRTLRFPLRGRVETLLLVRDVSEQRQIEQRDAIIQLDLEQAAAFQTALLSRMRWPSGLDVDVAYRPLQRVGGDVYDVAILPDGATRMFIADATGHGVTAALSTMLIKSEYDAVKLVGSPSEALAALNERITRTYARLAVMFTAAIVDISQDRRLLRHACGGHPAPLLCTGPRIVELAEGGPFLGVAMQQRYPEWTTEIEAWHSLVLVTDGVSEQRNASGAQFGDDRLRTAISEAVERGRKINASVLSRLDAYIATHAQTDDITLLTVQPAHT
jgi:PAS domain S-box-containing protein